MKIRESSKALWSLQCKEFSSNEEGRQFLEYINLWTTAAETLYEERNTDHSKFPLRQCFDDAMEVCKQELGELDGSYLGPMLMYIIHAWEHGEELGMSLSVLETLVLKSAVQDYTANMQAMAQQAQEQAEGNVPGEPTDT